MIRTFFVETWGCQMNHHDSERLAGVLLHEGFTQAESAAGADVVLLNTCSVREKPVRKILGRINELARISRAPAIGVCGCVAQQEGEELLKRSGAVSFVLGPGQIGRVGEALRRLDEGARSVFTGFEDSPEFDAGLIARKSPIRGMVTIIEGCDEYCTFCIVPHTRGREVSRPAEDVTREIRALVSTGIKEIELLGQTINSYRCPVTGIGLAELLRQTAAIPGTRRIRFITSHPRHFGPDLVEVLAEIPKLSRYLHLPFQAGSDRVLRRMKRRYTRQEYLDLARRIQRAVPDINLSTDVIVGFPGETEDDFQQTLELIREIRFGQVFAFAYSPRPGTAAARFSGPVPETVQKERLGRLFEVSDRISKEENEKLLDTIVAVLIDGVSRKSASDWQGRGEDNRVVNFPATGHEMVGDIVDVEILRAFPHSLAGRRVGSPVSLPVRQVGSETSR